MQNILMFWHDTDHSSEYLKCVFSSPRFSTAIFAHKNRFKAFCQNFDILLQSQTDFYNCYFLLGPLFLKYQSHLGTGTNCWMTTIWSGSRYFFFLNTILVIPRDRSMFCLSFIRALKLIEFCSFSITFSLIWRMDDANIWYFRAS